MGRGEGETAARAIFEGRRIGELAGGAQFTLWCLRARVECQRGGEDPTQRLGRAFRIARLPGWEEPFERLFQWVNRCAHRTVHVGCLRCHEVTAEEGRLLAALAAFQTGDVATGERRLAELLPAAPARSCGLTARQLADALRTAGLEIAIAETPPQPGTCPHGIDADVSGLTAPGSASIH